MKITPDELSMLLTHAECQGLNRGRKAFQQGAADAHDKSPQPAPAPSSPTGFARQQLEFRASSLESDVAAAVRRAEAAERLVAIGDNHRTALIEEIAEMQNRAKVAETRVAEIESLQYGGWAKKARESAREAADANGKLVAVTAERDALRDNLAMLVARHDEVIAERDRLQSMIARATAAGYCDYSDTDEVAVALRAEAEADRTLGRLVRAMPDGAELLKGGGWQVTVTYDTPDEDVIASGNTPEEALRAVGITLPEETAADGVADGSKN